MALIAAAAPTLTVWMGMNISSGGEEERGVEGGSGVEVDGEKRGGRRKKGRMRRSERGAGEKGGTNEDRREECREDGEEKTVRKGGRKGRIDVRTRGENFCGIPTA